MQSSQKRVDPLPPYRTRLEIAVAAKADIRTVTKFLRGDPVQPMPQERIEAVLRARVSAGLPNLLPAGNG